MNALPDLVDDPVTQCAKALDVSNVEQVFLRAAADGGFTNPQAVAAHRYNQWLHDGYNALPPYIKSFCARSLNKLSTAEYTRKVITS